jgi:hypothetical protein
MSLVGSGDDGNITANRECFDLTWRRAVRLCFSPFGPDDRTIKSGAWQGKSTLPGVSLLLSNRPPHRNFATDSRLRGSPALELGLFERDRLLNTRQQQQKISGPQRLFAESTACGIALRNKSFPGPIGSRDKVKLGIHPHTFLAHSRRLSLFPTLFCSLLLIF